MIAAPPLAALQLIDDLAGPIGAELGPDAVITDVVSTKGAIVARAESAGVRFVGRPPDGRPRGRRVRRGAGGAVQRPAVGRRPGGDRRSRATASESRPSRRPAAVPVAMTGGRPRHGRRRDQPPAARRRRGARRDGRRRGGRSRPAGLGPSREPRGERVGGVTRLARGDVAMGTGIAATNAPAIAARLRELCDVLDSWLADLEPGPRVLTPSGLRCGWQPPASGCSRPTRRRSSDEAPRKTSSSSSSPARR